MPAQTEQLEREAAETRAPASRNIRRVALPDDPRVTRAASRVPPQSGRKFTKPYARSLDRHRDCLVDDCKQSVLTRLDCQPSGCGPEKTHRFGCGTNPGPKQNQPVEQGNRDAGRARERDDSTMRSPRSRW